MIDYQELIERLQQAGVDYPDVDVAVKELYQSGKSLRQISELTGRLVSSYWLKLKLLSLGVTLRSRGGPNYTKLTGQFQENEWNQSTCQYLATQYGVTASTISKAARRHGYAAKKKRRFFRRTNEED